MLFFGCLLALTASFAPRLVLVLAWIFSPRWDQAFNNFIWPLLGIIFLPYTTIMFLLAWSPGLGIVGWDWMWIFLGVLLDFWKWSSIVQNRRGIPGYSEQAPETVPASAAPLPAEKSPSTELERLAELRDQGLITDEEYEAKRKEILDL